MPSCNMTVFAKALLLAASVVPGAVGTTPLTNGVSTETPAPQDLGYVTSAGLLVHSVNMCTIVHSTVCQPSVSTEPAASPAGPSPAGSAPPAAGPPALSSERVDAATYPAEQTPTKTLKAATTMTRGNYSRPSISTSDDTLVSPTLTDDYQPTSSTVSAVPVSTGASNSVSVVRGVAIGAGAMAVAFLF